LRPPRIRKLPPAGDQNLLIKEAPQVSTPALPPILGSQ